ncbi:CLUMA_CG021479, isoform A [Clunio marinus]|uniref:CLUMA_CG021479, isoform A n=1 Tax=Clunio marinus TaxID=568069 RepID=A0A1J1JBK4_9DIPT|nr:CLUMA_CG021479, isoform A [Clunio marinus]
MSCICSLEAIEQNSSCMAGHLVIKSFPGTFKLFFVVQRLVKITMNLWTILPLSTILFHNVFNELFSWEFNAFPKLFLNLKQQMIGKLLSHMFVKETLQINRSSNKMKF